MDLGCGIWTAAGLFTNILCLFRPCKLFVCFSLEADVFIRATGGVIRGRGRVLSKRKHPWWGGASLKIMGWHNTGAWRWLGEGIG